ncbi:MAG: DUF58 domain-containing protein [Planctomycetota bacterium]|jgi:uncharacterized protein (DUF58 family)
MSAMPQVAHVPLGDEPRTPLWIEWRLAIYPLAFIVGGLSLAAKSGGGLRGLLFATFVVLMITPLVLKIVAWGGFRRSLGWLFQKRLRITREGYAFSAFTILFGVAAINTGTNLLYLILSMLLSLMAVSGMLSELNIKGLSLARGLPREIYAGAPTRLRIVVGNPRRFVPTFALEVRERAVPFAEAEGAEGHGPSVFVSQLTAKERKTLEYEATFPRRGVFALEGFELATRFPFGFFVKFARADLARQIVVYPRAYPVQPGAIASWGRAAEHRRARARSFEADEFRSLRPYRPGDNPRWIHWRSSARTGELLVKEFEPRATRRTALVLDTDPGVDATAGSPSAELLVAALDRGTTLATSVVRHLEAAGEEVEVCVPLEGKVARFGERSGGGTGLPMLECFARLDAVPDADLLGLRASAGGALRKGARLVVVSARPVAMVRRALEAELPGASGSTTVLSFARHEDLEQVLVLTAPVDGSSLPASHAGRGGAA